MHPPTRLGGLIFDADDDGDLDLADWVSLADCLGGPTVAAGSGCVVHDFTRDGAVDLADAAEFQRYFSEDGNPASVACRRAGSYAHDADGDRDVDIDDYLSYESCLAAPPDPGDPGAGVCLAFHDSDAAGRADGDVDLDDFGGLLNCFGGSGETPPPQCFRPAPEGVPPSSGSFALHGGMVDVLSTGRGLKDELILLYHETEHFWVNHGRFLKRASTGYLGGANLYEAFSSNPLRFTDPLGTEDRPPKPEVLRPTWRRRPRSAFPPHGLGWKAISEGRWRLDFNYGVGLRNAHWKNMNAQYDLLMTLNVDQNLADFFLDNRTPRAVVLAVNTAHATSDQYNMFIAGGEPWYGAAVGTFGTGVGGIIRGQEIWDLVTYEDSRAGYAAFESPEAYATRCGETTYEVAMVLVPAKMAPRGGGASANSLGDLGRAGVNLGEDAARAAGAAPAGTAPPAIGEQLLFPFMTEDAALAAPVRVTAPSAGRQLLFSFMEEAPKNPYNISTAGMSAAERQAVIEYARRTNAWLAQNGPATVQPTAGVLRSRASAAARRERLDAARRGTPYSGQVGHVPDTALTGLPDPPAGWLDMIGTGNNVAGGGLSSRIGAAVDVITIDGVVP